MDQNLINIQNKNEIVTIGIVTYNSSKTIVDTLESVKNQTYEDLYLIIGDDCSIDNTLDIVRGWLQKNCSRFVGYEIISPAQNTGVAANINRVWAACETQYFKGCAGDDLLEPCCVSEYMDYVKTHKNSVIVFSKVKIFGPSKYLKKYKSPFDYSLFELNSSEILNRLITSDNCIPAPTLFLNMGKVKEMGITCDERIPMLEDYPLWINFLRKGVDFGFIDKELVDYRIGGNGLTSGSSYSRLEKSIRLFKLLYIFPEKYKRHPEEALKEICLYEEKLVDRIMNTKEYKLGHALLSPIRKLLKLI